MHVTSLFSYTWRAAKLSIFTHFMFTNLPRCNQNINSLVYVYSIHIPAAFYECLITVMIALLRATAAPKKFCITPWKVITGGVIISSSFVWCSTNVNVKNIQVISAGFKSITGSNETLEFPGHSPLLTSVYNQTNLGKDYPWSEDNAKCEGI